MKEKKDIGHAARAAEGRIAWIAEWNAAWDAADRAAVTAENLAAGRSVGRKAWASVITTAKNSLPPAASDAEWNTQWIPPWNTAWIAAWSAAILAAKAALQERNEKNLMSAKKWDATSRAARCAAGRSAGLEAWNETYRAEAQKLAPIISPSSDTREYSASGNAITLPAQYYHDASLYEKERQKLFFSEWLLFCHESLLSSPGHYVAYTIAGRPIMVIRAKDGSLKGFHNVCRHRASQVLKEGCGKTEVLRCMYHGWVYDTDGNLCKTPGFGGEEKSLCSRTSLFPIHVQAKNGLVFISMSEEPPMFEKSLGDLPQALQGLGIENFHYFDMATHAIRCNWKTYVENYMEGYHIPTLHPGLNREIDFSTYKIITGDRIARHETGMREESVNGGLWIWLWPNAALNVYKNGMNLELIIPTGPETMELRYCYLFKDVSPAKETENRRTIDMSFGVTQEDIDICEIVQKNLKGGIYERGELSPRHENGVAYFQQLIGEFIK